MKAETADAIMLSTTGKGLELILGGTTLNLKKKAQSTSTSGFFKSYFLFWLKLVELDFLPLSTGKIITDLKYLVQIK